MVEKVKLSKALILEKTDFNKYNYELKELLEKIEQEILFVYDIYFIAIETEEILGVHEEYRNQNIYAIEIETKYLEYDLYFSWQSDQLEYYLYKGENKFDYCIQEKYKGSKLVDNYLGYLKKALEKYKNPPQKSQKGCFVLDF